MARSVDDLALLLSVIAGPHPDDPLSLSDDPAALQHVTPADVRGLRVAWAPTLGDRVRVEQQVLTVLEPAVQLFESLGADVEPACPDLTGADETFRTLRASQFDLLWGDLLAAHPDAFKPDLAWNIRQGQGLTGRAISAAFAELTRLHRAANAFFEHYDVLLAPVSQVAPFDADLPWPAEIDGFPQHSYLDWMASSYLISTIGAPAISVPAGFTPNGLPVGLQIVTRARTEKELLAVAATFEAATNHGRRIPQLDPIS
jgi:amidase